jgi:2-oxoisovalerate dehydrogenase E2 component (dihydrolipoyl transacylase)
VVERVFMLPDLGEGLDEGKIVAWLVAEGDDVQLNQPLVEVETAKAVVEIPSPFAGRIASLHGGAGEDVPVGAALVTFDVTGLVEEPTASPGPGPGPRATPPVRRLAKELGVDLTSVTGTGPEGRITEDDIRAVSEPAPTPIRSDQDAPFVEEPISARRRAIAERLTRVEREVPMVTTWRTVDCSALEDLRSRLGVSPLPIFVRALADTLVRHPTLNSSWDASRGVVRRYGRVDVGLGVDTEQGLRTIRVKDVGALSISALSTTIAELADAARDGSLRIEDATGSTITVSNTGSYGSEAGTPFLNPGEAAIVALGVIGPRALVVDGQLAARPAATISLTFDHRVLDGAEVGRALTDLVQLLQSAERLEGLPR